MGGPEDDDNHHFDDLPSDDGGDGKSICMMCKKPRRALCFLGEMEYDDGSYRECPNYQFAE